MARPLTGRPTSARRPVGGRRVRAALAVLALVAATTACGQDAELKAAGETAASAVPTTGATSCAAPTGSATLPKGWPKLPLVPDDLVLTSVEQRSDSRTVVAGVVPRPFKDVLQVLRSTYQRAGLVLDHGEVEPRDAESSFHGKGSEGRWALREVSGCPGSTTLSLVVKPVS